MDRNSLVAPDKARRTYNSGSNQRRETPQRRSMYAAGGKRCSRNRRSRTRQLSSPLVAEDKHVAHLCVACLVAAARLF